MQAVDNKQVAEFYDKLWADLDKKKMSGINSRHRFFLRNLKRAGLKKNSRVLEIGCGLGTLTNFIADAIPSGHITGVDISPESVEFAKRKYAKKNMSFIVSDMTNFNPDQKFDFIVFPDVLEHIPIEVHSTIFASIRKLVNNDSTVLINIPNPMALEYLHIHNKEALQIIDQPLHTYSFLKAIYENGFYLISLETYSIFYEQADYQSMILKPFVPLTSMDVKSKSSVITKSIWLRLVNLFS